MAHALAKRLGTSATGAVREALREALARETPEEMYERLIRISRESAAMPVPFLAEDDLYDDRGLPK